MNKTITIYNTEINAIADLDSFSFLKKVDNVKMIRTRNDLKFTFYPQNEEEIKRNRRIWEFINGNLNALNYESRYYFVVEFPEWLYLFLKFSTWNNIEKSIVVALTGLYAAKAEGRIHIKEQIEPSIFREVEILFDKNFSEFKSNIFILADDFELLNEVNSDFWEKEKSFIMKFDYFFRDNSGNPILLPFIYPVNDNRFSNTSLFTSLKFNIDFKSSYFTDSDWQNIILNNSTDELKRAESAEEPWRKWKLKFKEKFPSED